MQDLELTRRSLLFAAGAVVALGADGKQDYPLAAVPFTDVDITDEFWSPRIEANRDVSIWHCFEREKVADFGSSKLIEAAGFMLAKRDDPKLRSYVDGVIDKLCVAVEPRLSSPERAVHVSGHLLEAAVTYFRATGNRKMLDLAVRDADYIEANYGPGKRTYISGHEGQKIGLLRLYRETGDVRYWQLAKFFLDERGKDDYPRTGEYAVDRTYAQDHERVVKQADAVGHCVRATFLYIALTDIAALTGDPAYSDALDRIWKDAVYKKTYVTGSIGSIRFHEQYGAAYELPNLSAWSETCASYGNIAWNHKLFLLRKDAQYLDVLERILYNGFLSGVSVKGDRFFYQNPLKSFGDYDRFEWIDTPCCPPNVVRLVASLGSYIYAFQSDAIYVNLFVASTAQVRLGAGSVQVRLETRYPWSGAVRLTIESEAPQHFAIFLRIPGWSRNQAMAGDLYRFTDQAPSLPSLSINGKQLTPTTERGFLKIERTWRRGDTIELDMPMPVRRVEARSEAKENRERLALQRGPLVYCLEWPDNGGRALNAVVPSNAIFRSNFRSDLLGGVQQLNAKAAVIERGNDGVSHVTKEREITAIPYYAWANRGMGEMQVWIPTQKSGAWLKPIPASPIVRVASSGGVAKKWTGYNDQNDDIGAIFDGFDPISSADESTRYFRMRPPSGNPAWLEYEFHGSTSVSSATVYWFDDRRFCRTPKTWRLLYKTETGWEPVLNRDPYVVEKDKFNRVTFETVTTTALRLEVEPQTSSYRAGQIGPPYANFLEHDIDWRELGILEWRVG